MLFWEFTKVVPIIIYEECLSHLATENEDEKEDERIATTMLNQDKAPYRRLTVTSPLKICLHQLSKHSETHAQRCSIVFGRYKAKMFILKSGKK